jgi:hypothetical protein
MASLCRMRSEPIAGDEVLADCARQGRYDPGPFPPNLVDEPCEEDDGTGGLDDAVDASIQRVVRQPNGCKDRRRICKQF